MRPREHRAERDRPAVLPVLRRQDQRLVHLHLRRAGAAVHVRLDQPGLAVGPYTPGPSPRLPARLLHGHPGGRAAHHARWSGISSAHVTFSVLIPFALPLGIIPRGAAFWSVLRAMGHRRQCVPPTSNDRPRNAPVPPAVGIGALCSTASCGSRARTTSCRQAAYINKLLDFFIDPVVHRLLDRRVAVIVAPIIAYFITNVSAWPCSEDRNELLHGTKSGSSGSCRNDEFHRRCTSR